MKSSIALIVLSVLLHIPQLAAAQAPSAADDCLQVFRREIAAKETDHDRKEYIAQLYKKELECLYQFAELEKKPADASFFAGPDSAGKVQRFYGSASNLFWHDFEMHFFRFKPEGGQASVYGYHRAELGESLNSPGWFQVIAPGQISYAVNAKDLFNAPKNRKRLQKIQGLQFYSIKNNRVNLKFHARVDTIYRISDDIAIGRADRLLEGKTYYNGYYLIVRAKN